MSKRKKIIILVISIFILSLCLIATYAYFNAQIISNLNKYEKKQ